MVEIKIPSPGESITEVEISSWLVKSGDFVELDQEIAEIETDKATLSLVAEASGIITILVDANVAVKVGAIACKIDNLNISEEQKQSKKVEKVEEKSEHKTRITPLAKALIDDNKLSVNKDFKDFEKITKEDVLNKLNSSNTKPKEEPEHRKTERAKMSMLRRKLSQRLVAVKNQTAMLTTFNEIDMSNVISLRNEHKEAFFAKYGVKLGFMSFFTKAVTEALKQFPVVNSQIDGDEIILHKYSDVGIAVQTERGLMVPVLRNTELMSISEIEQKIAELAEKGRNNKISIDELTGGTFTITNGGVFGSLLSTPILNPPQSAILGMHNIVKRAVVVNDEIVIRPMMYVALSYDHRIVDGKDSVGFLVAVKNILENWEEKIV